VEESEEHFGSPLVKQQDVPDELVEWMQPI
jgi:hypothetical protein